MWVLVRYFRQHPWQRRALTASLAAILGVSAAWVALPVIRDRQIFDLLAAEHPMDQQRGIAWALRVAADDPVWTDRLERALPTAPDRLFAGIVEVLNRLGRFRAPGRAGEQLDRYWAMNLAAAAGPGAARARGVWLHEIILGGRDNPHVRAALTCAAGDESPEVRAASAVLAARLGDDATLLRLLADAEPAVRAAAAIDAGLAGRTACLDAVSEVFAKPVSDADRAAAAYALARLDGPRRAKDIAAAIDAADRAGKSGLRDLLLSAASLLKDPAVGGAVAAVLDRAAKADRMPPAMAFVAAAKMELKQATPHVAPCLERVIARQADKSLTYADVETLAAAIQAARRLKAPVAGNVAVAMARLWHRSTSRAMVLAAEMLAKPGAGATTTSAPAGPRPTTEAVRRATTRPAKALLTHAVVIEILRQGADRTDTPVPAAAAAVTLMMLGADEAYEAIRIACESETWLAGDYVAWRVGRWGHLRAGAVAAMLFDPHEYNKAVRSAGAVLWALLARDTREADAVAVAIESRLKGAAYGGEKDPFVAGSYHCALLMLGRGQFAEAVVALAEADTFPKRRALAALALAGHPAGLDLVLADSLCSPAKIDGYLTGRLMAPVYAATVPGWPGFDTDAPVAVRHWQCRVVRDFYLIGRREILERMRP